MGLQPLFDPGSDAVLAESTTLRQFGVRWAILAAWRDDLVRRGVRFGVGVPRQLGAARVKIASGCFSSCEVGCDLAAVERELGAADASSAEGALGFWIELLGRSMASADDVEQLLRIPVVKAHFIACGRGCRCDH